MSVEKGGLGKPGFASLIGSQRGFRPGKKAFFISNRTKRVGGPLRPTSLRPPKV
jgi:hypothetical protein